jgi:hypothetical protein
MNDTATALVWYGVVKGNLLTELPEDSMISYLELSKKH